MHKLSRIKIDFCGKKRNFRRCTARELKNASKGLEDIEKEMSNEVERLKELVKKGAEFKRESDQIYSKTNHTKANERKAEKLIKEAEKIETEINQLADELEEKSDEINERFIKEYDKICQLLLEPFQEGEFIKEHDSIDMIIAKNLQMFYDMYMTGMREEIIEGKLKELVEAEHEPKKFPWE